MAKIMEGNVFSNKQLSGGARMGIKKVRGMDGSGSRKRGSLEPDGAISPALSLLGAGSTKIPDSPDDAFLEVFENSHPDRDYEIRLDCPEFTAVCPITSQPDFGCLEIEYVPGRWCLESKSLKLYLGSFRNHGVFHEAVVNRIRDDIVRAVAPRRLRVTGCFNPRGGISIRVTADYAAPATRRRVSRSG